MASSAFVLMSNTKPPVLSSAEIARSIPQAATIATTAAKPTALTGRLPYNELCLKIRLVTETDRANAITKKLAAAEQENAALKLQC